jgi:hypothetical protein
MDQLTIPVLSGCMVMVFSGPFRVLQEGRKSCFPNLGVVAPYYLGNPEKGPRGGLYVPTLWGGGGGLAAHPEGMPQVGEPQEKELCAGPSPLSAMLTDQVEVARFFREVFKLDRPWPLAANTHTHTTTMKRNGDG